MSIESGYEDVVQRVDALFQRNLAAHEEIVQLLMDLAEQSDYGGVECSEATALQIQRLLSESYAVATRALLKAHDDVVATIDEGGPPRQCNAI